MSPDRPTPGPGRITRRAALIGPLLLAACGFAPAYAPEGPGRRLRGRIAVDAPDTPDGFRLRAALEDRLGRASAPGAARLVVAPEVGAVPGGLLPDGTAARERLDGRLAWRLVSPAGTGLAEGTEEAFAGATVAGPAASVRAARRDARERLMVLLADRLVASLLLLPPEVLP